MHDLEQHVKRVFSGTDTSRDSIPKGGTGIDAGKAFEFLHAGWRGHIDLGQAITDHINADKHKIALLQDGADRIAYPHVAVRQV